MCNNIFCHTFSLTRISDNWVTTGTPTSVEKYYINVCRSLNHVPVGIGCDVNSAVCSTKFEGDKVHSFFFLFCFALT